MQAQRQPLGSTEQDTTGSAVPANALPASVSPLEVRPFIDGSEVDPVDSPARLLQEQLASRIQHAAPLPAETITSPHGLPVIARIAIILTLSLALWVLPIAAILFFAN